MLSRQRSFILKMFLFLTAVMLFRNFAFAASSGIGIRMAVRGTYENLQVNVGQTSSAQYAGPGYGGSLELLLATKVHSLGLSFATDFSTLDNRSNNSTQTETLNLKNFYIMPRLYAANVVIGLGFRLSFLDLTATTSGSTTQTKYLLYGGRAEIGYNFQLGKKFSILPQFHYDFSKTIGYDGSGHKSSTGMSGAIEFGLTF